MLSRGLLLRHERPFSAPIAAVVALSIPLGLRKRRAVERAFGVPIGTGAAQIGAVVARAMGAAVHF